ncbi:alpha-N-acetylneuraminate alpha-2,8-sialyltransferase ST8SIA3-like [Glandiceps talaboti]
MTILKVWHSNLCQGEEYSIELINEYVYNLSLPWKRNLTALLELRNELGANLIAWRNSVATQENTQANSSFHFTIANGRTAITAKVHKLLPKRSPLSEKPHSKCSLVGNSMILNNSGCGMDIDQSDFVFRCNVATIREFAKDVGRKTNLTSLNKMILRHRYGGVKGTSNLLQFEYDMMDYEGIIWIPAFANHQFLEDCYRLMDTFHSEKHKVVFGHPDHYKDISIYWLKKKNLRRLLTTGFYLANLALQLCDELHIFGFWPFLRNPQGELIQFHYHDDIDMSHTHKWHSLPLEFKILNELHHHGILQLHIQDCR